MSIVMDIFSKPLDCGDAQSETITMESAFDASLLGRVDTVWSLDSWIEAYMRAALAPYVGIYSIDRVTQLHCWVLCGENKGEKGKKNGEKREKIGKRKMEKGKAEPSV
jgi:hypothetical protein